MAKIVCVLYDDPVDGYPTTYPRDHMPTVESYPGGQTVPSPRAIDFTPGQLLGSVSGELGLRPYLEALGQISNNAQKLVFLPYEASGIMASLGGIKELLQAK